MSGKAVDTNVLIRFLKGEPEAQALLSTAERVYVPAIVAGELFYGSEKSKELYKNHILFSDFLSTFEILPVTYEVAQCYAEIKARLVKKGINVPENDLWIAATAQHYGLEVLSFDKHFEMI
jgi:tRNA(fMet)-specific endonuclease VapC